MMFCSDFSGDIIAELPLGARERTTPIAPQEKNGNPDRSVKPLRMRTIFIRDIRPNLERAWATCGPTGEILRKAEQVH